MTSKTLSVKLLRESIKRNLAFGVLLTLVFFCYFPIGGMLYLKCIPYNVNDAGLHIFGGDNPFLFAVTFAAASLLGILQFSYLHSQEKTDFYHSLPVRRERLFVIQYLAGVIIWLVPYAVNNILYQILCIGRGASLAGLKSVQSLAAHLACFLLVYSCMVLAMMLTGKIFAAIAGMLVFCVYFPGIRLLLDGLMSAHFQTYYGMRGIYDGGFAIKFSPLYVYYRVLNYLMGSEYRFPAELLLAALLTAALTAVICICLYRRRASEAAGSAMAFKAAARVIKFAIVVPCALMCYLFFYFLAEENILWGIFGLILGLIIFSGLTEFIYCMDIREIFRDKGQLLLTAAVCMVIMSEFLFDLTGYDKWIPGEKEAVSAEIDIQGMGLDSMLYVYEGDDAKREIKDYDYNYLQSKKNIVLEGDRTDLVRDVILHSGEMAGFAETADENGGVCEEYRQYYVDENDNYYRLEFTVTWHMKNGKEKKRVYSLSKRMWKEHFGKIWEFPEVQETCYPVLNVDAKDVLSVTKIKNNVYRGSYEWSGAAESVEAESDIEFTGDMEELMKTLKEELRAQTLENPAVYSNEKLFVIYKDADQNIYGEEISLTDAFSKTKALFEKKDSVKKE